MYNIEEMSLLSQIVGAFVMCKRVQVGNWILPLRKGNGLVVEAGQESLPGSD